MTKQQTSQILSIVLTAVIALAAVFGYNVLVVQPQMTAIEQQVDRIADSAAILALQSSSTGGSRAVGDTNFTNLVAEDITASDDLTVGDDVAISGDLAASGPLYANAPTAVGTATPALMVNSAGLSNLFEVRDAATPVFYVNNGGAWTAAGAGTFTGGFTAANAAGITAPTAVGTATPALIVDSLGVSNVLSVRKAGTPVAQFSGAGQLTLASGLTAANASAITAPTAIGTATPALIIDTAGVSNPLSIRKNATPVAVVSGAGQLTLSSGISYAALMNGTAASAATATNGAPFAISGTWQPITAAGTVTPTITIPAAGTVFCVYNTSANTINIADSGNQVLTSAFAMGQYDVLCAYSDGTRIIETARANN